MTRSKEGFERSTGEPDSDETRTPRYQQEQSSRPYYGGQESWREFPRKSTAASSTGRPSTGYFAASGYDPWDEERRQEEQGRSGEPRRARPQGFTDYSSDRGYQGYRRPGRYGRQDQAQEHYQSERVPYDRAELEEGYPDSRGRGVFHWNRRTERPYDDYSVGYRGVREEPFGRSRTSLRDEYPGSRMRCRELMTKDVTVCSPNTSIREVAAKMDDEGVGSIPIVEDGRLLGIITDRDIVCRVLAEGLDTRTTTAAQASSEDIVTATPDEPITEALRKMGEFQVRRLPIVDMRGRLAGIVSLGDIALEAQHDRRLAAGLQEISRPLPNSSRRR